MKSNIKLLRFLFSNSFLSIIVSFSFSSCNKDNNTDFEPTSELLVVDISNENLGYDYFVTDGIADITIGINENTGKPNVATIRGVSSEDVIHVFLMRKDILKNM